MKKRTEQERRLAAALTRERTLAELTGALAAELDETLVLQLAVDHAARLLEAPRARVWLVEPDRSLVCAASHDAHGPAGLGRQLPADSVGGLVATGETLTLDDITAHPAFHNLGPGKPGPLRAYLGAPIRRAGVPLGTIEVLAELGRRFGPDEAGLLRVLADAVAVAVANARSHRAVRAELAERQRAEALERHLAAQRQQLLELSRTLLGTLSLDEVIDRILAGLGQVLAYDMAGIYVVDEPAALLRPRRIVGRGPMLADVAEFPIPIGRGILGAVAADGRAELVNDTPDDPRSIYPPGVTVEREHMIVVPIRSQGRTAAVLSVSRGDESRFAADELELVELFASHASIAFEHAGLFEELLASEAKYRALFEGSRDAVYICSADGRMVDTNQAGVELLGYGSRDEVVGLDVRTIYAEPAELTRLRRMLARDSYVRDFGAFVRRKDGALVRVVQTTAAERAADGRLLRFWGVARDVTKAHRAEQALRAAERRAQQGDKLRSLGQMASGIAHDLNQQLALVVGHGELALRDLEQAPPDVASAIDSLRTVVRAAIDGSETVKRLLSFSRGQGETPAELVDLGALLAEVAKLTAPRWRDAAQLEGRPIKLSVESTGDTTIDGWPASLREGFANLVLNAIDALPEGGAIRLLARRTDEAVEAVVEDDGMGMPADVLAHIWEPFYSTKGEGGTGLGLSIVRDIVAQHRARIWVESSPGQGTRFRLTFAPSTSKIAAPAGPADQANRTGKLRILAVDDEPALRAMMARVLEQAGHRVVEAGSGEEALAVLKRRPFDVVVSDVAMGAGMNGWELAEVVRKEWPRVRFVLATGWGAQIDPAEAAARGAQAVVSKPYRIASLLRAIRREQPT